MMRRSAGFDADEARRQLLKEWHDVPALELTANDYITCRVNSVDLKNRLGDIETNCRDRLHVWLLRIVGASTAPTSMALPCRWRSRPQHQKLTEPEAADDGQGSAAGGVWVAPDPLERKPPSMGCDQLMDRFRPPISGGIKPDRRRRLEQRHRHLPKPLDALGGREQRMVAAHRVEDQALIGFEHVADQAGV